MYIRRIFKLIINLKKLANMEEKNSVEERWIELEARLQRGDQRCDKEVEQRRKQWFNEKCRRKIEKRVKVRLMLKMLNEGTKNK